MFYSHVGLLLLTLYSHSASLDPLRAKPNYGFRDMIKAAEERIGKMEAYVRQHENDNDDLVPVFKRWIKEDQETIHRKQILQSHLVGHTNSSSLLG